MTAHAKTTAAARIDPLQLPYGFALLGVVVALPITAAIGVVAGEAPAWLLWAITSAVGVPASFAASYWRLRPVPPGNIALYGRVIRTRLVIALTPMATALVLYAVAGHWSTVVLGALWTIPGLAISAPSEADYERHQELWNERLPMPAAPSWGTADPEAIPPWEDPDGGHGHGIGHHGLH